MKRDLRIFGPLAALVAALALGACVGAPEGPAAPFTRAALEAEALPTCSADDLAVAEVFEPVLDDAGELVGMLMGEPLCRCTAEVLGSFGERPVVPRMLVPAGQSSSGDKPPLTPTGFLDGTGVIQDPTPQPARPTQPDSSSLAPAPPTPVANSDKN
ncbi:MAG: hypothetical protein JXB32_18245 [Deltaproteobacteria bacterium]|nr:hypothetical protein [Deltaproteobacteria bacterium]